MKVQVKVFRPNSPLLPLQSEMGSSFSDNNDTFIYSNHREREKTESCTQEKSSRYIMSFLSLFYFLGLFLFSFYKLVQIYF